MGRNSKNVVVKFPTLFTIEELQRINPDVINITLRYKVKQAEERGIVKKLGKINKDIGRPALIYGKSPIDNILKEEAVKMGAILES